jgi:hypothetical protein
MAKKVLSATQQKNKATLKEKLKALTVQQLRTKLKGKVKLSTREGKPLTKAQLVNKAAELQVTTPTQKRKRKAATPTRNYTYKGQAGVSKRKDAARPALPPGKRTSATGKTYYEYRRNRADIKQGARKGQMLGGYNGYTNYETWLAALWFDNDRSVQRALQFAASAGELQDAAHDYLTYNQEIESGWLVDIINNAYLQEVNWEELLEKIKKK